jgi:predicted amidohydrolase
MKVTIIQSNLYWEDKVRNLEFFEKQIVSIKDLTDLIVLPEMFTTGFSMKPERFSEPENGITLQKMQTWAKAKDAAIVGSFIVEEDGKFYNRAYFVFPDGHYQYYNKRHLFRMAKEDEHYTPGTEKLIVEYQSWRILLLVCYDLRFPVWSRNENNYDIAIYVANWPERRSEPWKTLLKARAIENLSYVIGVNRIGDDGNNISHSGDSAIIDFKGDVLSKTKAKEIAVETVQLDQKALNDFRTKFPAHFDADDFQITL